LTLLATDFDNHITISIEYEGLVINIGTTDGIWTDELIFWSGVDSIRGELLTLLPSVVHGPAYRVSALFGAGITGCVISRNTSSIDFDMAKADSE